MIDYIMIGESPIEEDCAQVGRPNYYEQTKVELNALRNQMRRLVGQEPLGAQLKIKGFSHDFGTYHELVCEYSDEHPEAEEYAYRCENELPTFWDQKALEELVEGGYPAKNMNRNQGDKP